MSSVTNLSTLKINYLTKQQYQDALDAGEINENELYMTPAENGGGSIVIDDVLSPTSVNAVQNKVIYSALNNKVDVPNYITNSEIENMLTM